VGAAVLLAALVGSAPSLAEPNALYSHFQGMSPAQLAALQVQLTYLGNPRRSFPSVALSVSGNPPDSALKIAHRPGFDYGQASGLVVCVVSSQELGALIDSVATLPDVTAGDVDSLGQFSFAMVDTADTTAHAFEAIVNETSGLELIDRMRSVLKGNPRAAEILAKIACGLRAVPRDQAGDVSGAVMVTFRGFAHDPRKRQVSCVARVMNRSKEPLPAPLILALDTKPGTVRLVDADGYMCHVFHSGCPYVLLPVEGALAPGVAVERPLIFDNPGQENFEISQRLFSGWAER
jgi:hypothetical protein